MLSGAEEREFIVVLPACDKDCQILLRNLEWMRMMEGRLSYTCLVTQDSGMNRTIAREVLESARATFTHVHHFVYPAPKTTRWPEAPNLAFQRTAIHISDSIGRPWFWMEPDLVPLRPGWCATLQQEYAECGQPIMGSVVTGRRHVNGTAIYPPQFPFLAPSAMRATNIGWDWVMRDETLNITHDASRLMFHCWGIVEDKPHPYEGRPAVFLSIADIDRWIPREAVTFHRCKDATLIQRLIERKYGRRSG